MLPTAGISHKRLYRMERNYEDSLHLEDESRRNHGIRYKWKGEV